MLRLAVTLASAAVVAPIVNLFLRFAMFDAYVYQRVSTFVGIASLVALCVAAVLFVVVGIRRGEQRRVWNDFIAGRPAAPAKRLWMIAIVIAGLVAPVAAFLLIRVPMGCSVLNLFGLPWPNDVTATVLASCAIVALVSSALTFGGMAFRSVRSASVAILWYWAAALVPGFFVLFLSLYGDPGPTTCQ